MRADEAESAAVYQAVDEIDWNWLAEVRGEMSDDLQSPVLRSADGLVNGGAGAPLEDRPQPR